MKNPNERNHDDEDVELTDEEVGDLGLEEDDNL